jgi:hypothetical protein
VYARTEGNPLFVTETTRLLVVEGLSGDAHSPREFAIPRTVQDVIARRLAHLSQECNRLLVLASVLGREFAIDMLARLAGVSQDQLLEVLDEALVARVLVGVPGLSGRIRFAHVLIRDAVYEGLTATRRIRLHRFAADALEALYGSELGPHFAELAHHALAGSDFEKGLRYARQAADRAISLLAYEEGARLYETALDVLDLAGASNDIARCDLLLQLGDAHALAGNTPSTKSVFIEAAGLARRARLSHQLARAAAGYGGRLVWARAGDDDQLVPLLEEGLAAAPHDDAELRARLLARLAGALRDEQLRDRRDALSSEALDLARRSGDDAALAYALDGRAAALFGPDTVAECLALADELTDVAARCGNRTQLCHGHLARFQARVVLGDFRGAQSDIDAIAAIAEELKQPLLRWHVRLTQALVALSAGRIADAGELIPAALGFGELPNPVQAIPGHRTQWYALCELTGSFTDIEAAIHAVIRDYPARRVFRCVAAHLDTMLGRLDSAQQALDQLAENDFAFLPFDEEWLYGMSLLAETAVALGDTNSAAILYRLLVPWASLNAADPPETTRGAVSRYLGLLATTLDHLEDAEMHYQHAMAVNTDIGAHPWLARTQHDYARMLIHRNKVGDTEHAEQLHKAACATFDQLGMKAWADRTSRAVTGSGRRHARSTDASASAAIT